MPQFFAKEAPHTRRIKHEAPIDTGAFALRWHPARHSVSATTLSLRFENTYGLWQWVGPEDMVREPRTLSRRSMTTAQSGIRGLGQTFRP